MAKQLTRAEVVQESERYLECLRFKKRCFVDLKAGYEIESSPCGV